MTDRQTTSRLATPAETQNPGPATHAEQAAKKADHMDDAERRNLAEQASREEDA
jgi:hypothetical protein